MLPEERISRVVTTSVEWREEIVEVVAQDAEMKQVQREKQVVVLPQAERRVEDVWFRLFDLPTREPTFVPPGICAFRLHKLLLPSFFFFFCFFGKLLEDDFCKTKRSPLAEGYVQSHLFSVSLTVPSQIYPSVQPGIEMISKEWDSQQVYVEEIRLRSTQTLPERDYDSFVHSDTIREETVTLPPGIELLYV